MLLFSFASFVPKTTQTSTKLQQHTSLGDSKVECPTVQQGTRSMSTATTAIVTSAGKKLFFLGKI